MEIPTTVDYVGYGVLSLAKLDSNLNRITPFRAFGNVPGCAITQDVDQSEAYESMSGNNVRTSLWTNTTKVGYHLEVTNFNSANYELFTAGTLTQKTSVTPIVGRVLEGSSTIAVGDRLDLGAMSVSAVAIKDSTGTPKTLVLNTNYKLDADTGVITITDITTGGPYTGPLKADLTPGAYDEIKGMTTLNANYAIMFEGVNKITGKKEKRILGNVTIPPSKEIQFIGNDRASAILEGAVLRDKNGDMFTFNKIP